MSSAHTSHASGPVSADAVCGAPNPGDIGDRVRYLFRSSITAGRPHPLLRFVQRYRRETPMGPSFAQPRALPAVPVAAPVGVTPLAVRQALGKLPHLPEAAVRALQCIRVETSSLERVASEIGCDVSLAAAVLRLANSPFYGVPRRVSTLREAIQVLGRRSVESLLVVAAVTRPFDEGASQSFDARAFWRRSFACSVAARSLAESAGCEADQAFIAALLQDLGQLAMSVYFPRELDALFDAARRRDAELCTVEQTLGVAGHAEVGAWIAAHWGFPTVVVQAIEYHHRPSLAPPEDRALCACLHVADAVAHALDVGGTDDELVPFVDPGAWMSVAPSDEAMLRILGEADRGSRTLCEALSL